MRLRAVVRGAKWVWKQIFIFLLIADLPGLSKSVWLITVSAALWSVWLASNELVFDNKAISQKDLLFTVKMRTLIWIKAIKENDLLCDADWWNNPRGCSLAKSSPVVWCPPAVGNLKFNVDGAFKDSAAGCGGVLRTHNGDIVALFSGPVDQICADFSELVAVMVALSLFLETGWGYSFRLSFESDSQEVLKWVENISSRPWRWWDCFEEIDKIRSQYTEVRFEYVPREGNGMADQLAKQGMQRQNLFKAWWQNKFCFLKSLMK
ncbi:uncharacterized protein LOC120131256 [Hibiscus syriacus]|uniref:uncharacterized protein LOC120131256 n=1 Tax=Hibiscus syriacus TaxID=106335 RepID=UPI001924B74D|nr:uncharacterized protein LOC120131256 [Hibiscus syriacus]